MARTSFKHPEVEKAVKAQEKYAKQEHTKAKNSDRFPELLPSGSTMFNLACTDSIRGFMPPGTFCNLVGDTNAGKSIGAMTAMAATFYKYGDAFDYYDDDIEKARHWNVAELFGKEFAAALKKMPFEYGDFPVVETWYRNMQELFKRQKGTKKVQGKPFFCVTDSWDCLKTFQDEKQFAMLAKGKDVGSYGAAKAKKASDLLGKVVNQLANSNSNLIIVSQTHDSMNAMTFGAAKTRAGGKALSYYANVEVWLAVKQKLTVKLEDDAEQVGALVVAKVKRTRFTGKQRLVEFPIYYSYGIDDTESMLCWLEGIGVVKKVGKQFALRELDIIGSRKKLVVLVERGDKVKQLRKIVSKCWHEREQRITDLVLRGRKPKFS